MIVHVNPKLCTLMLEIENGREREEEGRRQGKDSGMQVSIADIRFDDWKRIILRRKGV